MQGGVCVFIILTFHFQVQNELQKCVVALIFFNAVFPCFFLQCLVGFPKKRYRIRVAGSNHCSLFIHLFDQLAAAKAGLQPLINNRHLHKLLFILT